MILEGPGCIFNECRGIKFSIMGCLLTKCITYQKSALKFFKLLFPQKVVGDKFFLVSCGQFFCEICTKYVPTRCFN